MEKMENVEAVGGSRGVRDSAIQAMQIFFALFIAVVVGRSFISLYHTNRLDQPPAVRALTPAAKAASAARVQQIAAQIPPAPARPAAAPGAAPRPAAAPVAPAAEKPRRVCPLRPLMDAHLVSISRLPIFILILLLGARLILSLRQVDRLYAESEGWDNRSFTGLLIHAGFLLAQVSLLAFMAAGLESEDTADPLAFFFVLLAAISGIWYLWSRATAGRRDAQALRYAVPAGISDLLFAVLTFGVIYLSAILRKKLPVEGTALRSPLGIAAFFGIVNVYLNYLIAVQAPDDPAKAGSHAAKSWVAVIVGVAACALVGAFVLFHHKLGIHTVV